MVKAERKEEGHKGPVVERPSGRPPTASVQTRHDRGMVSRQARGFSLGELKGAGLSPRLAANWGLMVDPRRRSALEENTKALGKWNAPKHVAAPKEPAPKVESTKVAAAKTKVTKKTTKKRTRQKKKASK